MLYAYVLIININSNKNFMSLLTTKTLFTTQRIETVLTVFKFFIAVLKLRLRPAHTSIA